MIESRLTHVDVPVRVSLMECNQLSNPSAERVMIEVPKFAMLMPLDQYNELSQDPPAMAAFLRSKISASFKAQGTKWPHTDVLRTAQGDE